ncbi:F-box domain-containing protein [Cephalotus follicularis]|uniref:F-box domain-containing protein n=1 Tax=Cephalotus follicularis TaxID=3775 RepID=A0A1Q3BFY8_CEPFO|nr:F-box domain-containing protein [Cephalotus follicularis]
MKSKRISHDSGLDALSCDDILCNILFRLPPESVFKFITVSKKWLHLICSPSFRHSYLSWWKTNSRLLGFFVCNSSYLGRSRDGVRRPKSEPALLLLSTCEEGDDLTFSGILKQLGYFIDSSNGFLLCGRHPKTYYVWNPNTKEKYQLPRPRVYFEELCMAFMVEECPDGSVCYKVIRAKCDRILDEVNTVTIESFSSDTTTWSYSTLTCSSTLSLSPRTVATVIGGVIHWYAEHGNVAIYKPDDEDRHIELIKLPGSYDCDEKVLGESFDGLLQYGESTESGMAIWVLEREPSGSIFKWNLRCKLKFKTMWKKNPTPMIKFSSKETQILSFLPQNSESVFIRSGCHVFLYHFESERVELVHYNGRGSFISWDLCRVVPYFIPAWPYSSLCR